MKRSLIALITFCNFSFNNAYSQITGALDNSFSDDGIAVIPYDDDNNGLASTLIQPDGKILIIGNEILSFGSINITRLNNDGSIDESFGDGGFVKTSIGEPDTYLHCYAATLLPDGKILVVGQYDDGLSGYPVVLKYNADGTLDLSFGVDGFSVNMLIPNPASFFDVCLLPDGKFVCAGSSYFGLSNDLLLARFNTDGSIDNTFDDDGFLTSSDFGANTVDLTSEGDIIVGGGSSFGKFKMMKFHSNGSLDLTFGIDGITNFDAHETGFTNAISKIEVLDDNAIIAAGNSDNWGNYVMILSKFKSDGTIDLTFATDGIKIIDFGGSGSPFTDFELTSDGKITMLGYKILAGGDNEVTLSRYKPDGTIDFEFGDGGSIITLINGQDLNAIAIAIQADDKIVVAGNYSSYEVFVLRYLSGAPSLISLFEETEIKIFPNPSTTSFQFANSSNSNTTIQVNIYDDTNHFICSFNTAYNKSNDVSKLLPGIYLITLLEGSNSSSYSLIIQ
ncbi:MAG TPA: T9SS type A sorting domain-containing protein [Chitinophagales bacterium]|nr:T9SS type A sorting domain-containing protein [Chitinophagales bacterium]HRG28842.1 T9SS type A sorting domain-containing protein [Chitinophagales bacterium]